METLSRREEQEIEAAAKEQAMRDCGETVKAFADCATGRTFTIPFACASQFKAMNGCVKKELTEERLDALKLSYIANRSERGREAVEQLTAQRKAKLLRMAGKKAEAEQVEKDLEAVRSSRRAAEGNGR